MYAIYGNIYHQYTPNVSIYTIWILWDSCLQFSGGYTQCPIWLQCSDMSCVHLLTNGGTAMILTSGTKRGASTVSAIE